MINIIDSKVYLYPWITSMLSNKSIEDIGLTRIFFYELSINLDNIELNNGDSYSIIIKSDHTVDDPLNIENGVFDYNNSTISTKFFKSDRCFNNSNLILIINKITDSEEQTLITEQLDYPSKILYNKPWEVTDNNVMPRIEHIEYDYPNNLVTFTYNTLDQRIKGNNIEYLLRILGESIFLGEQIIYKNKNYREVKFNFNNTRLYHDLFRLQEPLNEEYFNICKFSYPQVEYTIENNILNISYMSPLYDDMEQEDFTLFHIIITKDLPFSEVLYELKIPFTKTGTTMAIRANTSINLNEYNLPDGCCINASVDGTSVFPIWAFCNYRKPIIESEPIIPTEPIIPMIVYDNNELTDNPVTATITFNKEGVEIIGNTSHTFMSNGSYEFSYKDTDGSIKTIASQVKWIVPENYCKTKYPCEPCEPNDNNNDNSGTIDKDIINIFDKAPADIKENIIKYSNCISKLTSDNKCDIPIDFINFILVLKAYEIALMSGDETQIKIFEDKLQNIIGISNINNNIKNCNCKNG